jgi:peptide-methionine (S)-S-oxide reductase
MEKATFGGGCFWCIEAIFQQLKGVESVIPGYAGGHVDNPTYEQVCRGNTTGHAEVVQVTYDPEIISYRQLLQIFWHVHDPTTPNRQGADVGPQYRSIVLTHNDQQYQIANEVKTEIEKSGLWDAPIVTEIVPLEKFYPAEAYHRDYFLRNPNQGYCNYVIAPKVAKFRKTFADLIKS